MTLFGVIIVFKPSFVSVDSQKRETKRASPFATDRTN